MNTDFTNKDQTISNLQDALAATAMRASNAERRLDICRETLEQTATWPAGDADGDYIPRLARRTLEEIK